jgi:hypothetical protein
MKRLVDDGTGLVDGTLFLDPVRVLVAKDVWLPREIVVAERLGGAIN